MIQNFLISYTVAFKLKLDLPREEDLPLNVIQDNNLDLNLQGFKCLDDSSRDSSSSA
jgi:hypothetical protein